MSNYHEQLFDKNSELLRIPDFLYDFLKYFLDIYKQYIKFDLEVTVSTFSVRIFFLDNKINEKKTG